MIDLNIFHYEIEHRHRLARCEIHGLAERAFVELLHVLLASSTGLGRSRRCGNFLDLKFTTEALAEAWDCHCGGHVNG